MSPTKTLLKGGTLLLHDQDEHVVPTIADLLISNNLIAKIAPTIKVDDDDFVDVIDCRHKIISPGFLDTHRHLWQSQLKGQHADQTLLEYFPCGNFMSSLYTPADMFWGQLSGCLESLDAGTTTVVDHASCNITAAHTYEALRATISSGIRCVFCYTPTVSVKSWSPFSLDISNTSAPWVMSTFADLAAHAPFGPNQRVPLGLAYDWRGAPDAVVKATYNVARAHGAHLITHHGMGGPAFGAAHSTLSALAALDLLAPDVLVSHANYPAPGEAGLLAASGAHISSTPSTELQMGHGPPLALEPAFAAHASLGIDCHSNNAASIPAQMNLLLQHARAVRVDALAAHGADAGAAAAGEDARAAYIASGATGRWARTVDAGHTVEAVFNLGTVRGAAAAGLGGVVGRLAEGMRADIVVFDGRTPGMLAAAVRDPVAAVVQHASVRDVEIVFVDGVVRKDARGVRDVVVAEGLSGGNQAAEPGAGVVLGWADVADKVLESRERIYAEMEGVDFKQAEDAIAEAFHMNQAGMV